MTTNPTPVICAVCRHGLNLRTTKAGAQSYVHTVQDPDDHEPAPVTPEATWRGRCDFCNVDAPDYYLPVADFELPVIPGHRSSGAWSACTRCSELIERDDWRGLLNQATSLAIERREDQQYAEEVTQALRLLYSAVRRHRTGPLQKLPDRELPASD